MQAGDVVFRQLTADELTPVAAYRRLSAGAGRSFLFESVAGGETLGRYSFIGADPVRGISGSWDDLRRLMPPREPAHPDLPPFTGGAVGFFSWDLAREFERLPRHEKKPFGYLPSQPVQFDLYTTVVAFDHLHQKLFIISREGTERLDEIEEKLRSGPARGGTRLPDELPEIDLHADSTADRYCAAVEAAREYIRRGDIFQAVLSRRFLAPFTGDPLLLYRALRSLNPSPYLFLIRRDDVAVVGSSPEMLLRVQGGRLEYRPIAGTRPRGATTAEDRRLEAELRADAKEISEHVMLVDLGRNDLGRVSRFGTVSVENLLFVERYSHVMHLVSALSGELADGRDCFDALRACFPAGTVSGAPKIRAMEIIEELESSHRGIYAGAIGYVDFSGNLDTCIAIRTIVLHQGLANIQAGAGIVADSRPEHELAECEAKSGVLVQAVRLANALCGGSR